MSKGYVSAVLGHQKGLGSQVRHSSGGGGLSERDEALMMDEIRAYKAEVEAFTEMRARGYNVPAPVGYPAPPADVAAIALPLLEKVAEMYGVTVGLLTGSSRQPHAVRARHDAAVLLRESGYTLQKIGEILHRHHSTILYALECARGRKEHGDAA